MGDTLEVTVNNGITFQGTGIFNVEVYGAVGGGIIDDYVPIQAAINAAIAAGGGTVDFGNKSYLVETELLVNDTFAETSGVRFRGVGINATSILAGANNMTIVHWAGNYGGISNIGLDGNGFTGVSGLRLTPEDEDQVITRVHQDYNAFDNMRIEDCAEGIVLQCGPYIASVSGCYFNTFNSIFVNRCTRGLWFKDGPNALASGSNRNQFFGVRLGLSMNTGIQIDAGGTNTFLGCSIEECQSLTSPNTIPTAIKILKTAPVGTRGNGNNQFFGMAIEACTRDIEIENSATEIYGHSIAGSRILYGTPIAISSISKGATCTVTTSVAHGYSNGERVLIDGGDMTEIDGVYEISGVAPTTLVLVGVDSTAYTTYTTGGTSQYSALIPNVFISAQSTTVPVLTKLQQYNAAINDEVAPNLFVKGGTAPDSDAFYASKGSLLLHTGGYAYTKHGTGTTDWGRIKFDNVLAAPAEDTTPSVAFASVLATPPSDNPVEIIQLDDAVEYQQVTILCTSSTNAPTITDGGNFALSSNWAPASGDTLTLITVTGTDWFEISRSTNT